MKHLLEPDVELSRGWGKYSNCTPKQRVLIAPPPTFCVVNKNSTVQKSGPAKGCMIYSFLLQTPTPSHPEYKFHLYTMSGQIYQIFSLPILVQHYNLIPTRFSGYMVHPFH